jgi:hypothetical protein
MAVRSRHVPAGSVDLAIAEKTLRDTGAKL